MQWLPFILETVNNTCHNQNILTSFQIIWKIVQFNSSNGKNGRMYDFRHLSVLSNTNTKKLGSLLGITPCYVWDYYGNFRVGVYCFVNSYYILMYSCFLGLLHRFQVFWRWKKWLLVCEKLSLDGIYQFVLGKDPNQ